MNDDDIAALRTPAPPPVQTPARSSRPWRWALLGLLAFSAVAVGSLMLLLHWLGLVTGDVVSVTVDGETWRLGSLDTGSTLAAAFGLLLALLVVLFVVPLALALGLVAAVLGIGVGMLAVLAAAALVLSPLLLPALLLWWLLRPGRPAAA